MHESRSSQLPLPGLEIEEKTCSPDLKCKCPEPVYSNDGIISASICRCAEKGKECTNPEYRLRNPQIEEKRCDDGFYCKCAGGGPNVINLIPTCDVKKVFLRLLKVSLLKVDLLFL